MGSAVVTADNILFYSIVAAVVPVALYVGLIYGAAWYEKEPWWLLSAAFLWGAGPAALLAFLFNSLVSLPFYYLFPERAADLVSSGAVAPVVEEIVKALVLFLILIVRRQELDSPLDGIIYGAMVGMGFAMVENVLIERSIHGKTSSQFVWRHHQRRERDASLWARDQTPHMKTSLQRAFIGFFDDQQVDVAVFIWLAVSE